MIVFSFREFHSFLVNEVYASYCKSVAAALTNQLNDLFVFFGEGLEFGLVIYERRFTSIEEESMVKNLIEVYNLEQFESDTVLPTTLHRCDISSKVAAVLPGGNNAEFCSANSLHAST